MLMINEASWTPRSIVISLSILSILLFYSWSSFGDDCVAYCKARQVRHVCHETIKSKGLNGDQRDVEFEKCKVDPMAYKQIEQVADDVP